MNYLDQLFIEQTSTPEGAMIRARHAVTDLLYHRFGNTEPHAPGDPFFGTTQLEQVLAEIHGTFEDVEG